MKCFQPKKRENTDNQKIDNHFLDKKLNQRSKTESEKLYLVKI
jgi:hypothetical protein